MIELLPLHQGNLHYIVNWNKDKNADFVRQWAGKAYYYPLTEEQIKTRLELSARKTSDIMMYEIILDHTTMIGTIELFNIDKETLSATMGRFLIAEEYRRKGYAQLAIKEIFRIAKNQYKIETLRLNVYEYNVSAQKCYEKAGYVFDSIIEDAENPRWNLYAYVAELYAMDIETGKRILPDIQPEVTLDDGEVLDIYEH